MSSSDLSDLTTDPGTSASATASEAGANAVPPVGEQDVHSWVAGIAELTQPDEIVWCDGSAAEKQGLIDQMLAAGTLVELNQEKRPGSYLARSNPADVARVESRTFICSQDEEDAGPTNNWVAPDEMRTEQIGRASCRERVCQHV